MTQGFENTQYSEIIYMQCVYMLPNFENGIHDTCLWQVNTPNNGINFKGLLSRIAPIWRISMSHFINLTQIGYYVQNLILQHGYSYFFMC